MGGRTVGSETEGNIEAGFAHRAVAFVIVGAEADKHAEGSHSGCAMVVEISQTVMP